MAGWHHRRKGHELGQTPGDGEGQGGLACCSSEVRQRVKHDLVTKQQQKVDNRTPICIIIPESCSTTLT